jgi:hypothetical protein
MFVRVGTLIAVAAIIPSAPYADAGFPIFGHAVEPRHASESGGLP